MTLKVYNYNTLLYYHVLLLASFNPPDLPSDDEAPPTSIGTQQELDEEEVEWQRWLADLMNPQCQCVFIWWYMCMCII